ncbi:MAG: hypothetical protein ACLGPL_04875 [Acidobacteriota bacterium]
MQKVTPIPFAAVETINQVRRRVFCKHYGTCLDYAIAKNWRGFSCDECEVFEDERVDRNQMAEENERCIALAYMVGAMLN